LLAEGVSGCVCVREIPENFKLRWECGGQKSEGLLNFSGEERKNPPKRTKHCS